MGVLSDDVRPRARGERRWRRAVRRVTLEGAVFTACPTPRRVRRVGYRSVVSFR